MYRHAIVVLSCSIRATRVREMSGGDGKRGEEITVYILYIEITVYIYIIKKNNHGWRRGVAEAGGGAAVNGQKEEEEDLHVSYCYHHE